MTNKNPSSLLRQWQLGESVKSMCLNRNGRWVAAALQSGHVALAISEDAGEEPQLVKIDDAEIISLIPDCDDHAFLVLTDNGKIFIAEPQVQAPTQIAEKARISCIATSCDGHRVFSVRDKIFFLDECGELKKETFAAASDINDLQFSADGTCLAASHAHGITAFVFTENKQELVSDVCCCKMMWGQESLFVTCADKSVAVWSPANAEPNILRHDMFQDVPIIGGMTAGNRFLATAGARQAILFPIVNDETLKTLGGADRRLVTQVAPHPYEPFIVIGYDDGMIVMASIDGLVPIMIHAPAAPTGAAVTGLVWNSHGDCVMATLESGWLMLFTEKSIQKAVRARMQS